MLDIRPTDIAARMRFDNPWWQTGKLPEPIVNYQERDYFAGFRQLVETKDPHRSVVLLGPRRTGKTIMLYQLIASQISNGTPAHNLFYCALDTPTYSRQSLQDLLNIYLSELTPESQNPIFVFFDEVQYLKGWEIELKSLTDSYRQIKFVVSGSAATALKTKSQESGAGRFTDFILPPLTFAEFLRMTGVEKDLIRTKEYASFEAKDIILLNREFVKYLNFGGYPEVALSAGAQDNIARFVRADILDKVLLRDLPSIYGIADPTELFALFNMLAFNTANEVSLEKLSQKSNVSKNTLKKYLEYLEAAFLIKIVERVDSRAHSFQRSGTFKVYLANASLRSALFGPLEIDDEKIGSVAETAVFSQWMHAPNFKGCMRYARWDDKEVDMVYVEQSNQKPQWAVEVKWSDRHAENPDTLEGLLEFGRKNPNVQSLRATTRTFDGKVRMRGQTIELSPTAVYCYTVGKNVLKNMAEPVNTDQLSLKL